MEKSDVLFLHFIIDWIIILCVTEKLVIAELTAIMTYTFVEFTLKSKAKVTFLSSDSAGSHYGGEVFKGTSSQLAKDFQAKKFNDDAWYDNVMSYESSEPIDDNTYSKTYTLDKGTYTFYTSTIKQDSTHKVKISAKKKVLKFKKLRTLQIFSGMY